jgi:hypothetical protein
MRDLLKYCKRRGLLIELGGEAILVIRSERPGPKDSKKPRKKPKNKSTQSFGANTGGTTLNAKDTNVLMRDMIGNTHPQKILLFCSF